MALMAKAKPTDGLKELEQELVELANAQHDSYAYEHLFSVPLTVARVRIHHLQKSLWVLNRRECWAYAQAAAPFDVKQLIWDHEREELQGDQERGLDNHYALEMQQGAPFDLGPEDYADAVPSDGTITCLHAWTHLAKNSPWLKSFAASAALEMSNSEEILRKGGASRRMAQRIEEDLGITFDRQQSFKEHIVADVEHANIMMEVARRHAHTAPARQLILEGARESWAIDRIYRDNLARLMEAAPD
jgi:pyrroloquinoline quinone (PQQ) biosynthesis protein C